MHKLLVQNEWYETLPPHAIPDTAFEELLHPRADLLFPGFFSVRLRYRVSNDKGHAGPQLALIEQTYRSWWLVLLETGEPPPAEFIKLQAEIVRAARFGREFATLLASRNSQIDLPSVEKLVLNEVPGLFVILGHPPAPQLDDPAVRIGIAEVFRSPRGEQILRINGRHPEVPDERLGTCERKWRLTPSIFRLVLINPASVIIPQTFEMEVEGTVSTWTCFKKGTEQLLVAQGAVHLPAEQDLFALLRGKTGRYRLVAQNG